MPRKQRKYNERIEIGRGPDGKRIRKWIRADSLPEFKALRRQAYKDADKKAYQDSLWGNYADLWYETYKANRSLQTQQMYQNAIRKMSSISAKKIASVTSTDLQRIINDNWDHPRTCEVLRLTMKQVCKQAVRDKLIPPDENPAEGLEIPKAKQKETRFIQDDEMEKILLCPFKDQDRLYIDVLRNTGMRPSEALALDWQDIDFKDKVIHVRRSFEYKNNIPQIKTTKTDKERDIPLNTSLASTLILVRQAAGYVFVKEDGGPFTKSAYNKMYHRIFSLITDAIGENNLVMYSFRHTFATFLYYHGCRPGLISTKKASQIMGHSEKIFLERYTHIDDSKESIAEILEQIPNFTRTYP